MGESETAEGRENGIKLIERFIQIDAWPTGRKTTLVMVLGLGAHLADWLIVHLLLVDRPGYEIGVVDTLMLGGALAFGFCLLAGMLSTWGGGTGNWTPYLFVVLGGTFFIAVPYAFGLWTSPTYAVVPTTILLTVLWYGRAPALALLGFYAAATTVIGVLQATGALPYGPALSEKPSGALRAGALVGSMLTVLILVFTVAFSLALLVVEARRLQESRLGEARLQLERSNALISQYVPIQLAEQIMAGGDQSQPHHERRRLSIFFSDLVGFTDIAEELEPEDLSQALNMYFTEMTAIAHRHGGTVDELVGDAILILFGAPHATDDRDHARRAVCMAVEMQHAMDGLNRRWREMGIGESLVVRMGINTGIATIGTFGSPERMKYTAMGKHVNLAARLQTNCEPGRLLISRATWLLVNDSIDCVPKGELSLKGIVKPVMTYAPKALEL